MAAISGNSEVSFAACDVLPVVCILISLKCWRMNLRHWASAWGWDRMTFISSMCPFDRRQCLIETITSPIMFISYSLSASIVIPIDPSSEFSIGTTPQSTSRLITDSITSSRSSKNLSRAFISSCLAAFSEYVPSGPSKPIIIPFTSEWIII